jgi:hypothetical protein
MPCGKLVPGAGDVGGTGGDPGGAPMNCGELNLHPAPPPVKLAVIVPLPVAEGPLNVLKLGVTAAVPDAGPVPAALVAVTEQLYAVPFARPVIVIGEAAPLALRAPGLHVTVKLVMADPPLEAGAVNAIVA